MELAPILLELEQERVFFYIRSRFKFQSEQEEKDLALSLFHFPLFFSFFFFGILKKFCTQVTRLIFCSLCNYYKLQILCGFSVGVGKNCPFSFKDRQSSLEKKKGIFILNLKTERIPALTVLKINFRKNLQATVNWWY